MTRLCELAEKWRTDKVKSILHDYTPYYDELLKGINVRRMVEIGIGNPPLMAHCSGYKTGASLFMWQEYFPNAYIYGLDVLKDVLINEGNIQSYWCDQGNETTLHTVMAHIGAVDFIIDDGSHEPEHQILSANALVPYLEPNGAYVIEDVAQPELVSKGLKFKHEIRRFQEWRHDDCLIIIRAQ